jgi:hypothetical protein
MSIIDLAAEQVGDLCVTPRGALPRAVSPAEDEHGRDVHCCRLLRRRGSAHTEARSQLSLFRCALQRRRAPRRAGAQPSEADPDEPLCTVDHNPPRSADSCDRPARRWTGSSRRQDRRATTPPVPRDLGRVLVDLGWSWMVPDGPVDLGVVAPLMGADVAFAGGHKSKIGGGGGGLAGAGGRLRRRGPRWRVRNRRALRVGPVP